MKNAGVNELRRMFLEFFESKGHLAMKSFSLVPHNDNSLLLINSGMAPLKPYFTGQELSLIHISWGFHRRFASGSHRKPEQGIHFLPAF